MKRKHKILVYLSIIVLLITFSLYLGDYRLSPDRLALEVDENIHFSPSIIVYKKVYPSRAIVVTQNGDWVTCKPIEKTLGFLWKFDGTYHSPINLSEYPEESKDEVMKQLIETCGWIGEEPVFLKNLEDRLNTTKANFYYANRQYATIFRETARKPMIHGEGGINYTIYQEFTYDHMVVRFETTTDGDPIQIFFTWEPASSRETNSFIWGLLSVLYGELTYWPVAKETADRVNQSTIGEYPFVIEDAQIRIECEDEKHCVLIYK